jgi:hypothetical protein
MFSIFTLFIAFVVTFFTKKIIGDFFGDFYYHLLSYNDSKKSPKYFYLQKYYKKYAVTLYNIKYKTQHYALITYFWLFLAKNFSHNLFLDILFLSIFFEQC